jgi:anti-anti-sigma regulatory factor
MDNLTTASANDFTPYLIRVNFDEIKPIELARMLMRYNKLKRPRLLIDCQSLRCLRTRGVAYFVSQLLTLQAAGAKVLLRNVDPLLHRSLRVLGLDHVFQVDSLHESPSPDHNLTQSMSLGTAQ